MEGLAIQSLPCNQSRKVSVLFHEFLIITILYDLPFLQHNDPVTLADRGQSVGDHNACSIKYVQGL